jgi:hypothetical protein
VVTQRAIRVDNFPELVTCNLDKIGKNSGPVISVFVGSSNIGLYVDRGGLRGEAQESRTEAKY